VLAARRDPLVEISEHDLQEAASGVL
jgi:hypothetical protein